MLALRLLFQAASAMTVARQHKLPQGLGAAYAPMTTNGLINTVARERRELHRHGSQSGLSRSRHVPLADGVCSWAVPVASRRLATS